MLNEPDDAFDAQLATGWDALAAPSDARARVRARLAASGVGVGGLAADRGAADGGAATDARHAPASHARAEGAATEGAGSEAATSAPASFGRALARRWQALLSSGGVGASVGVLLLGAGFFAGYRSSPSAPASVAPSEVAAPAPLAVAPIPAAPIAAAPIPAVPLPAVPVTAGPPARLDSDSRAARSARAAADDLSAVRERRPARAGLGTAPPSDAAARGGRSPSEGREMSRTRIERSPAPEELLLLERAERALRNHHPALATALIAELTQRFPRSLLHEERRAIELMARCQAGGDASAAASLRTGFERDYPTSVYAERVARDCGAIDASPSTTSTNSGAPYTPGVKGGQHAQTP